MTEIVGVGRLWMYHHCRARENGDGREGNGACVVWCG